MTRNPSSAERLDRALDGILAGSPSAVAAGALHADTALLPLVDVAAQLRRALVVPPVAPRFEARLGARLAGAVPGVPAAAAAFGWALRHPGLVTGAVGSAAVGVGVTAYAVWRSRHPSAMARGPLPR